MVDRLVAWWPVVAGVALVARPKRCMLLGRLNQVRHARWFVADALDGSPRADTAVFLADELVVDALVHPRSGCDGLFKVIVRGGRRRASGRQVAAVGLLSAVGGRRISRGCKGLRHGGERQGDR
jgi:hypothetical protein